MAPGVTVAQLNVTGMHCSACVALVEEMLLELDGVSAATVSLADERATVTFDPDVVNVDSLCATVAEAGYAATPAADGGGAPAP
jgi:copper chaperone CopZ